jgi:hypothetical protein
MSTQTQCRQIAAELRSMADRCTHGLTDEDIVTLTVTGADFTLTVSCPCTRQAVLAVAAKFEKGPWHKPQGYGPRQNRKPPAPVIAAFEAFADDGEWDNAREYLRQWPRDKWPAVAVERLTAWEEQA